MNIATTETTGSTKTKIYINMDFNLLAQDINSGKLTSKFTGSGQKVVLIPPDDESTYFKYTSDKKGTNVITPPFDINNGDKIKFNLQDSSNSDITFKWKGIVQDSYDLQLVDGKVSTYKATLSDDAPTTEEDDVLINITIKDNGVKSFVSWDPKVRIRV